MASSLNMDMKPRPKTNAKLADEPGASSHLSQGLHIQPRSPPPLQRQDLLSTDSTQPDLFASPGVVDAHTRHPCAFVASGTGFTVEARHGVDAAGARETRVRVSTLGTRREEVRPLPVIPGPLLLVSLFAGLPSPTSFML